mgnify:FL=1
MELSRSKFVFMEGIKTVDFRLFNNYDNLWYIFGRLLAI